MVLIMFLASTRDQSCRVRMISCRYSIIAVRAVSHIDEINIECGTLDPKDIYGEISLSHRKQFATRAIRDISNCSSFIKGSMLSLKKLGTLCVVTLRVQVKDCDMCSFLINFSIKVYYTYCYLNCSVQDIRATHKIVYLYINYAAN